MPSAAVASDAGGLFVGTDYGSRGSHRRRGGGFGHRGVDGREPVDLAAVAVVANVEQDRARRSQ